MKLFHFKSPIVIYASELHPTFVVLIVHEIDDVTQKWHLQNFISIIYIYVLTHWCSLFYCEALTIKTLDKYEWWKCCKHGFEMCKQLLLHILCEMCFIKQKMHCRPQKQHVSSKITKKYTFT
jgi:hypothetical protein